MIFITSQGEQGFRCVRRQFLRLLQGTFRCLLPSNVSWVITRDGDKNFRARKPCPCNRKPGVKLHRPLIKTGGFLFEIDGVEGEVVAFIQREAAQIYFVSLWIVCWFNC